MPTSSTPIRIGIVGYGNLGRGVEAAIAKNPDMATAAIYTRRDPAQLAPGHGRGRTPHGHPAQPQEPD